MTSPCELIKTTLSGWHQDSARLKLNAIALLEIMFGNEGQWPATQACISGPNYSEWVSPLSHSSLIPGSQGGTIGVYLRRLRAMTTRVFCRPSRDICPHLCPGSILMDFKIKTSMLGKQGTTHFLIFRGSGVSPLCIVRRGWARWGCVARGWSKVPWGYSLHPNFSQAKVRFWRPLIPRVGHLSFGTSWSMGRERGSTNSQPFALVFHYLTLTCDTQGNVCSLRFATWKSLTNKESIRNTTHILIKPSIHIKPLVLSFRLEKRIRSSSNVLHTYLKILFKSSLIYKIESQWLLKGTDG